MKFNMNEDKEVVVLLGAGSMGTAIIKRISTVINCPCPLKKQLLCKQKFTYLFYYTKFCM